MELPLVRLVNKFLFYFCSTSLSEKYFVSLSMFFFLFIFLMERVSLDFKGRRVKGELGHVFLLHKMWSYQHLISKKEDSLYK